MNSSTHHLSGINTLLKTYHHTTVNMVCAVILCTATTSHAFDLKGSFTDTENQRYVPPVSNPLFNETPYITTEIRPIYLYNSIPDEFVTGGGQISVLAAEVRIALTERLGFIASKDGYVNANFDAVLPDTDGFANISAGLKYALFHDKTTQDILTIGVEYEVPFEDIDPGGIELQGDGDGFVDIFLSGAKNYSNGVSLQANAGANLALDGVDTSIFHFSAHVDYELFDGFYPLIELNTFVPIDKGTRLTEGALAELDGVDLVNFGSSNRDTTVTGALGFRYRFTDHIIFGTAGELPLTEDDNSILGWRIYSDLVIHF